MRGAFFRHCEQSLLFKPNSSKTEPSLFVPEIFQVLYDDQILLAMRS